jgi:hypothetical protein
MWNQILQTLETIAVKYNPKLSGVITAFMTHLPQVAIGAVLILIGTFIPILGTLVVLVGIGFIVYVLFVMYKAYSNA